MLYTDDIVKHLDAQLVGFTYEVKQTDPWVFDFSATRRDSSYVHLAFVVEDVCRRLKLKIVSHHVVIRQNKERYTLTPIKE
jgi:hypothetical protein